MQPIHSRVGGLALALACSPNPDSEPSAAAPSRQTSTLDPGTATPVGAEAPPFVRDEQGAPAKIEVCPEVCATIHQGTGKVDLQIGCATLIR